MANGVIMYNRGGNMVVRSLVSLNSLRKFYDGDITFLLEDPVPEGYEEALIFFNCDVKRIETRHEIKTLARKNTLFADPVYEKNLWLDSDIVCVGKIDEMFDYLDDFDFAIPHFCGWVSDGKKISRRIHNFDGIANERHIEKALQHYPAINTGVFSFKNSERWIEFSKSWISLTNKGYREKNIWIADEISMQILYPSMDEWDLKYCIAPRDFNVSVLHDKGLSQDPRVIHFHGRKSVMDVPSCDIFKSEFDEMYKANIANIRSLLNYDHKRTKAYIRSYLKNGFERASMNDDPLKDNSDVTIVTACDEKYVEFLKHTFPNWRKYKDIDSHQVIVFVHGIPKEDARLDFLKLPNVKIIPWSMENADDHREEMLSAFVFGTAEHVKTDYWLKLDADSFATDDRPLITPDMKEYAFCGHKWGYSRPDHIKKLDEWAKGHWKKKLRTAQPMLETGGRVEGRRFYHDTKRTISFVQLHKTKFTRFCVKLLPDKKLPAPTQDTFMFFVANRFDPHTVGVKNFKRHHGFTQGNSRRSVDELIAKLEEVEKANQ